MAAGLSHGKSTEAAGPAARGGRTLALGAFGPKYLMPQDKTPQETRRDIAGPAEAPGSAP
jgi:hypothetical protein